MNASLLEKQSTPDETSHNTIKQTIKNDRIRFGVGAILSQSEEVGLGPVPTVIVRFLGGDDRHLGVLGSLNVLGCFGHLIGNSFLKWKQSNRKAMLITMRIGLILAGLIALLLLTGNNPNARPMVLVVYIVLSILFAIISGTQLNIESNWIGDLVPEQLRGWFTKTKWILNIFGIIIFTIFISRLADKYPTLNMYAGLYIMFAISFIVAGTIIYPRTTDKKPFAINIFFAGKTNHERVNYKSQVLWLYLIFILVWSSARTITIAFIPVYLIEQFHFTLTKIALLLTLQSLMSVVIIFLIGDHTDRWGSRKPLLVATLIVSVSMSLWFLSAWYGVSCAIAYMIINGASGHTLTMLGTNYQLEIYPAKGRAAYIAFVRLAVLPVVFCATFFSGCLLHNMHNIHIDFFGAIITRYHLIFLATTIMALIGTVPFLLIGTRRILPAGD